MVEQEDETATESQDGQLEPQPASEPGTQIEDTDGADTGEDIAEDSTETTESVAKSTVTMSMATLLSRITGFLRTWAIAFALGNTIISSAYQVANNIPQMIYELVAGGMLATAFLPIYVQQLETKGQDEAGDYAGNLLGIGGMILGVVTILATIFAPQVIATQTFMSDSQETIDLAIFFFRFFAIRIFFYGVGAVVSGILNSHKKFLWPALGPVFNNVIVIITMFTYAFLVGYNEFAARVVLGVGSSLGVIVMMCVQIPALVKLKIPIRIHIDFHDPRLVDTLKIAIPATVFVVVNIVVVSVRNSFSLGVVDNGPSTLSYAWLWYQFPYGVIAVALSTAMLTEMSEAAGAKNWALFKRDVKSGLSNTLYLIVPCAVIIFVLAPDLVELYHAGEFTAEDVQTVSQILRTWIISLPVYAGYMYMYRAFSAMQDLGRITWIDVIGRLAQAGMYALFTTVAFDGELGLAGIPIGDLVFYTAMFLILCYMLRRKVGPYGLKHVFGTFLKTFVAAIVPGIVAMALYELFFSTWLIAGSSILTAIVNIVILGVAYVLAFYGMSKLMHIKETALVDSLVGKVVAKLKRA